MKTVLCEYGRGMTYYHTPSISDNHDSGFVADHTIGRLADLRKIEGFGKPALRHSKPQQTLLEAKRTFMVLRPPTAPI